jgi:CubicO group peptidase (beta-lactamase class C family)
VTLIDKVGIERAAIAALVLALSGCANRGTPQLPAGAGLAERLARLALEFRDDSSVPAFQLGVIKDGRPIYAGAFGVRSLETNQPISARSLFHMASVSKPLVAVAIAQLAERGRLRLEDRVVAHLPYFRLDDARYASITVRQLLAHVSGLPDVTDYGWDKPEYDGGAAERYVQSLRGLRLRSAPGERFRYSNIGYDILGEVIAKTSGMSFEAYMRQNVFVPLKMADSTFLRAEVPEPLSVSPHRRSMLRLFQVRASSPYPYSRTHAPSSTLHSNVGDMLAFLQAMLDGQAGAGPPILSSESRGLLWSEQADQGLGDAEKAQWMGKVGLGWFIGSYRGHRMISYTGADPGFRASVALLPEKSIGVVCMGNSDTMRVGRLMRAALDLALQAPAG